jgi:hypothetical protein
MQIQNKPVVFMPEAVKKPLTSQPRMGATALNCLEMIQGKVVANKDKYFCSISANVQETCPKSDTVLQLAKDWLKQVKQQLS